VKERKASKNTPSRDNDIHLLLAALMIIGLIATGLVGAVGWWSSKNLSKAIDSLGNNSLVLTEGNLAISNTVARYLEQQDSVISSNGMTISDDDKESTQLTDEFRQHYQTLINSLDGMDTSDAEALMKSFTQFGETSNNLIGIKHDSTQLSNKLSKQMDSALTLAGQVRDKANSLAKKVDQFRDNGGLGGKGLFWGLSSDHSAAEKITEALVDKNTNSSEQVKSIVDVYISELERAARKLIITNSFLELKKVKTEEIQPVFDTLKVTLAEISKMDIDMKDYQSLVLELTQDVNLLDLQITPSKQSLLATQKSLLLQRGKISAIQKQLDQDRTQLLDSLEQLTQSGDLLARKTNEHAALVVKRTQNLTATIGAIILLTFLLFGNLITRRIKAMTRKIRTYSQEMEIAKVDTQQALYELQESNQLVTESIHYASKIQRAILAPERAMTSFSTDHFALWAPRDVVGGDMYLVRSWGHGKLILLADCTGHGVPGAFMTIMAKAALDKAILEVSPGKTAELISAMHTIIQHDMGQNTNIGDSDDGLDLAVIYISENKSQLLFSGARLSLFVTDEHGLQEIRGDKKSIGYRGTVNNLCFSQHSIDISSSLSFYLVTDGLIDQIGGEKTISFGKKRLRKLIESITSESMGTQRQIISDALNSYQGEQIQRDDVTVLGFMITPETEVKGQTTGHSAEANSIVA